MAVTVATVEDFKNVNGVKIFRYSALTILATENRQLSLAIPGRGVIKGICVVCPTSVDFDILLTQKLDAALVDKDALIQIIDITASIYRSGILCVPYYNNDTVIVSKLYLTITNTDAAHATGAISIEVVQMSEGGV